MARKCNIHKYIRRYIAGLEKRRRQMCKRKRAFNEKCYILGVSLGIANDKKDKHHKDSDKHNDYDYL